MVALMVKLNSIYMYMEEVDFTINNKDNFLCGWEGSNRIMLLVNITDNM